jgi:hypothetical protein
MVQKTRLAIVALAAAYLLATLIPGLAHEVSARRTDKTIAAQPAPAPSPTSQEIVTVCRDSWPYYQLPCLHDSRQPGGRARAVRIISIARS